MKEENKNIDRFFADRFDKTSEDDWSMPNDKVWAKAKPHFPVRNQKRRRGIFFLYGTGLLLLLGMIFVWNLVDSDSIQNDKGNNNDKQEIALQGAKDDISKNDIKDITAPAASQDESTVLLEKADLKKDLSDEYSTSFHYQIQEYADTDRSKRQQSMVSNRTVNQFGSQETMVSIEPITAQSNSTPSQVTKNRIDASTIVLNPVISVEERSSAMPSTDKKDLDTKSIAQEDHSTEVAKNNILVELKEDAIKDTTQNIPAESTVVTAKDSLLNDEAPVLPVKSRPLKEWAFNVANFPLFFAVSQGITVNDENGPNDIYEVKLNYQSGGLEYRKWLSHHWSVSSGLQLSHLYVNLDFSAEDTLEMDVVDNVGLNTDELGIRSVGDNYEADVFPGFTLSQNDIVTIKGNVELDLYAVQLPVILNRHWYIKNLELHLGVGGSVDFLYLRQKPIDFIALKGGLPAARIKQGIETEKIIDGSLYINTGIKYRISNRINIGFNLKADVVDPIFSTAQGVIAYRWNS